MISESEKSQVRSQISQIFEGTVYSDLDRDEDALHEPGPGGGAVRAAEGRGGDEGEPGVRHRPQELHPQAAGRTLQLHYYHSSYQRNSWPDFLICRSQRRR